MPRVSVILPTCDRPNLLRRSLASVLTQTYPDLEVVCVDNNRRAPRVRELLADDPLSGDPRLRVIEARHSSNAAQVRNAGLEVSSGDWIAYLDDDDEYLPGKIEAQCSRAEAEGLPIALCGYEVKAAGRRRIRQTAKSAFEGDALLTEAVWGAPFLFHRRTGLRFDPHLNAGEDVEYAFRLLRHFGVSRVPNVQDPLVRVHVHTGLRVNRQSAGLWRARRQVLISAGLGYSRHARRTFAQLSEVERLKLNGGPARVWLRSCAALKKLAVPGAGRICLNAMAFRIPFFRRWLVS